MRTTNEKWHKKAEPRPHVLEMLEKDASRLRGDDRRILFCFLSDPYQPIERRTRLMRQSLSIIEKNNLRSQVLTKGSADLILDDLDLMRKVGTELGVTLCFTDNETRKYWEPNASTVEERLSILKTAHMSGIFTWVSLEPVIDPIQALDVIRLAHSYVDFWKIGKLNHMKDVESKVDWRKFLPDVRSLLSRLNAKYYIKDDLKRFAI